MSINAGGEEDIPKRFPGLEIDCSDVDDQVDSWADLVQDGRKLTIRATFIFKETDQAASKKRELRVDRVRRALNSLSATP